jgi:hypothetical protein
MAIPPIISEGQRQPVVAPPILPNVPVNIPRRVLRWVVATGLCLIVLGVTVHYAARVIWSPRQSMKALAGAIDRRDQETVARYVDAEPLARSIRKCAIERTKHEMAKQESGDFMDRLGDVIGEEIVTELAEVAVTPDSVVPMLCGEAPTDGIKQGVGKFTDQTVDAVTMLGSSKTQVYGSIAKALIRLGSAAVIDFASEQAKAKQSQVKADDYEFSGKYETANRYLVTRTPRNSEEPAIGYVYTRQGLTIWKLTEMRLLPQKVSPHAGAA